MGLGPVPGGNRFPNGITISGGSIETDGNDLVLLPSAGKITQIGDAGSQSRGLVSNDDLFISGKLEVDGRVNIDGGIDINGGVNTMAGVMTLTDQNRLAFGSSDDVFLVFSTVQTPDSFLISLGADSKAVIICDKADYAVDFAFPQQANPTICIQSADATTPAQRLCLAHDQTNAVITSGAGDISLVPASGFVKFGTHAAVTTETLSGFITINDAGGTPRKVAIVS